jgi:hypothetical protein
VVAREIERQMCSVTPGDPVSPDAQSAKLIGLTKMVEARLLTREQFKEMKVRILGANE